MLMCEGKDQCDGHPLGHQSYQEAHENCNAYNIHEVHVIHLTDAEVLAQSLFWGAWLRSRSPPWAWARAQAQSQAWAASYICHVHRTYSCMRAHADSQCDGQRPAGLTSLPSSEVLQDLLLEEDATDVFGRGSAC